MKEGRTKKEEKKERNREIKNSRLKKKERKNERKKEIKN